MLLKYVIMCKNGKHKSKLFLKIKQIGLQAYIKLIGLVKKSMLGNFTRYCHFIGNMAATSFENIFSIEVPARFPNPMKLPLAYLGYIGLSLRNVHLTIHMQRHTLLPVK